MSEGITILDKRDLAYVIKLKILRCKMIQVGPMDSQGNHKGKERGRGSGVREGDVLTKAKVKVMQSTKVHLVKAMVFPVIMYGCESWIIRKLSAEELMLLNCGTASSEPLLPS